MSKKYCEVCKKSVINPDGNKHIASKHHQEALVRYNKIKSKYGSGNNNNNNEKFQIEVKRKLAGEVWNNESDDEPIVKRFKISNTKERKVKRNEIAPESKCWSHININRNAIMKKYVNYFYEKLPLVWFFLTS